MTDFREEGGLFGPLTIRGQNQNKVPEPILNKVKDIPRLFIYRELDFFEYVSRFRALQKLDVFLKIADFSVLANISFIAKISSHANVAFTYEAR